ncbi:(2Fe-2S)-binding protein [Sulfuricaulis sp.]
MGKNAIIDAIRQKRPGTIEEHCLKAGTNCGSCIPEIKA